MHDIKIKMEKSGDEYEMAGMQPSIAAIYKYTDG